MKIIGQGIVFKSTPESDNQSCCFPSISVLPSGRWLCAGRAAPTKKGTAGQHVIISWSDNQGRSWSKPMAPFKPPILEGKAGLFRGFFTTPLGGRQVLGALFWVDHSDPTLAFFNEKTEGLLDTRIFLTLSRDAGKTWTEPRLADTYPIRKPLPLTGPILLTSDGRWACQFEVNKHYDDTRPWRHSSMLMFSSDRGRTWPEKTETVLFRPPAINQTRNKKSMSDAWSEMEKFSTGLPATAALTNGDFAVAFYTGSEADKTDICWIHVRP